MNWLDFVDWQPSYTALKFLGIFLITGLGIGYIYGKRNENKKTTYKTTSILLVIIIAFTGYNWITTPHLSSGITLNCDIPETPDQITKIVIIRETYGIQEPYRPNIFARKFAGFSYYTFSKGSDPRLYYYGLYNLTFYGVSINHFEFNMPFKERYSVETLTEEQCIEKADQLIEEIRDYFNSSLEYRVEMGRPIHTIERRQRPSNNKNNGKRKTGPDDNGRLLANPKRNPSLPRNNRQTLNHLQTMQKAIQNL